MNNSRVILAVTLTALAGLGVVGLFGTERSTPSEVLTDVRARLAEGDADGRVLARALDRALTDPRTEGDAELISGLLMLRADVLEDLGDASGAREDLERVLLLYRRGDRDLELRAALLEAEEGQLTEALTRATRLARQPDAPAAVFRAVGNLERQRATAERDALTEEVLQVLVGEEATRATALIAELCARDADDLARRGLADELRELLPKGEVELAKRLLDGAERASGANRAARSALAEALGEGPDPASLTALVDLLAASGRPEIAADLALVARRSPAMAVDPHLLHSALTALIALGQDDRATRLIRAWNWEEASPSRELCELALEHLLLTGAASRMGAPIQALRATELPGVAKVVSFYQAVQASDRAREAGTPERWESAVTRLDDFLDTRSLSEPVPGAISLCHLLRAEARRALKDEVGEREDLLRALTPPDSVSSKVWLRFVTADHYLRMAGLSSLARNAGGQTSEICLTQAISLDPQRWQELMPTWNEFGAAALASESAFSFDDVYSSASRTGSSFPVMQVGPNTLYRVAAEHLSRNLYESALVVSRSLLKDYPGLVPAYDIMIRAQLARGSRVQVVIDLLDRMALTGPDDVTDAFLATLGEGALTPPQVLEQMRLDPEGAGRRRVAAHALEQGEPQAALLALGAAPEDWTAEPADLRLMRARAHLALGQNAEAMEPLKDLDGAAAIVDEALAVTLLAAETLEEVEPLDAAVEAMITRLAKADPPVELALKSARSLLARGRAAQAGALLLALDSRPETRSGAMLEAMAVHARWVGDRAAALEALERAEAFFGDGRVELRRLALSIEARDWRSVPALAVAARAGLAGNEDPWLRATLLLLEERPTSAAELAEAALAEDARDPRWALVSAAAALLAEQPVVLPPCFGAEAPTEAMAALRGEEGGLDPRELLGLLIASEAAGWSAGVPDACTDLQARGARGPWLTWMAAQAVERSGDLATAREAYQGLSQRSPAFGPAWDGWDRTHVALEGSSWSAERIRLRAGRAEAKADQGLARADALIDQACKALASGARDRALRLLAGGSELPGRRAVAHLLAHAQRSGNKSRFTVEALTEALPRDSARADDPIVEELVLAIVRATERPDGHPQAIAGPLAEARLKDLIERFPSDPLPVLTWCRLRAEAERRNPALVVDVITRAFDSLRARTPGRALAELRPGSAREWGEFLVQVSPEATATFLLEDLAITPGDLELWRLLARSIAAQDRTADATDLYRAVTTMSHDPLAHHDYAWFLIERGGKLAEVEAQLDAAEAASGEDRLPAGRLPFLGALSELRLTERPRLQAILPSLETLWDRRRRLEDLPTLRVGSSYVTALALRGQAQDHRTMERVLGELAEAAAGDPYVPDLVRALTQLAPSLPTLPTPSQERRRKPEESEAQPAQSEGAGG